MLPRIQFLPPYSDHSRMHGRRPSTQIPSRPPKGNRASPSESRGRNTERKCREFVDRHLGEHAIRSARQGRERAGRPSSEIFGGWRLARESRAGGRVEGDERSPAAVERAEGDRRVEGARGSGGGTWHREGGERIYKLEKLFLASRRRVVVEEEERRERTRSKRP